MADTQIPSNVRDALEESEVVPISVKEMLTKLAGVFPFDDAVLEGRPLSTTCDFNRMLKHWSYSSITQGQHVPLCGALWYKRLDNNRKSRGIGCRWNGEVVLLESEAILQFNKLSLTRVSGSLW